MQPNKTVSTETKHRKVTVTTLVLAAIACGKVFNPTCKIYLRKGVCCVRDGARHQDDMEYWKPHLDDGDSRRLQVALKISLNWNTHALQWCAYDVKAQIVRYDHDPKRAVLFVAAVIGEKMK